MNFRVFAGAAALPMAIALAQPALAAPEPQFGEPIAVGDGLVLDPIIEGRLRYESVDQAALDADALTLRLRAGVEARTGGLSWLTEIESTLALAEDYNAFPFPHTSDQRRPGFAIVADPRSVELNRLQARYKGKAGALTLGRQRINLDDQRWVGSVGWRQNEQTFDAVRGEASIGELHFDASYAISQRTIWGDDAGPRTAFDGDFLFVGAGYKLGAVQVKGFAYLLDFDTDEQLGPLAVGNADTQTYGIRAATVLPITNNTRLSLTASYARQSDYQQNPAEYSADYVAAEAGLAIAGLWLGGGYELLGSDRGRAVQTPMATLHKFNGWADQFLTTPAAGLEDIYGGLAHKFDGIKALPGLNAAVWYHRYRTEGGGDLGEEWNASAGFRLGKVALLAKYAAFSAGVLGTDTDKLWLQAEFAF